MPQQLLSQEELRKKAQELISDSPVLAQMPELRDDLLRLVGDLSAPPLEELLGLLNDEATDWQQYFQKLSAQQENLLTQAANSSLQLQKEAEKLFHGAEEEASEEEDSKRAEGLLNQL